ncbi:hypothetical protein B0A48_15605, partial [Cryoendolithus antarcticus]
YTRPPDPSTTGAEALETVNTNHSSPSSYNTRAVSTFFAPWAADEGFGSMFDGGIPDYGDWAAVAGNLETLPEVGEWQMGNS